MNLTGSFEKDLIACWPFDEGRGCQAQDVVSGLYDEIEYVFALGYSKRALDPRWVKGVAGKALVFDGYATWIERSAGLSPYPTDALTVTTWIAPRAFEKGEEGRLSAIINQHDRENHQGFILGLYRHGSWALQVGARGEWHELHSDAPLLPRGEWSFIAATFDGLKGQMTLYLNGEAVAQKTLLSGIRLTPSTAPLMIGKNNQAFQLNPPFDQPVGRVKAFEANMLNGLLDDLRLYSRALPPDEIRTCYQDYLHSAGRMLPKPDTDLNRQKYQGDPHRPQYHFIPPEHWQNEAHGLLYFAGQYHIFYQLNPQGPYWGHIHWGHAVSRDLVHWRDLPFALAPERHCIDPDGCWSGCSIVDDQGVPRIFYAAGDNSRTPNQAVGMAVSTFPKDDNLDLVQWEKHPQLIVEQGPGVGRFGEFRDPFVFKDGNRWYMLVGSGIPERGGTALLYSSANLLDWTYHHPFFIGDLEKYPKTGEVWELPGILSLGVDAKGEEKHIFVINPWFEKSNPHYCKYIFYWIGTFDRVGLRFIPDCETPQVINVGEHWIGPSYLIDRNNRLILMALAHHVGFSMRRVYERGWWHHLALPVEVYLRQDGKLGVKPIEELALLREKQLLNITNMDLAGANQALEDIRGDLLEIEIEFQADDVESYGLDVRISADQEEFTRIYYDPGKGIFGADTTRSSLSTDAPHGREGDLLASSGDDLHLRVYIDKSVIEAFANDLKNLTTIVYPSRGNALGLRLWGGTDLWIKSLRVWQMSSIYAE